MCDTLIDLSVEMSASPRSPSLEIVLPFRFSTRSVSDWASVEPILLNVDRDRFKSSSIKYELSAAVSASSSGIEVPAEDWCWSFAWRPADVLAFGLPRAGE